MRRGGSVEREYRRMAWAKMFEGEIKRGVTIRQARRRTDETMG